MSALLDNDTYGNKSERELMALVTEAAAREKDSKVRGVESSRVKSSRPKSSPVNASQVR